MAKGKVTSDFAAFYNQKHEKFEKARKGEEESQGIPMAVGTSGFAVIDDVVCAKSKTGKNYVRFDFTVCDGSEYQGKKFSKVHTIFESDNMTEGQRFQMMLDYAESIGVSSEVRHNMSDMQELVDDLLNTPHYVSFTIVKGNGTGAYSKDSSVEAAPDYVPPQGRNQEEKAPSSGVKVSDGATIVQYLGSKYELVETHADGTATIRHLETGNEKTVQAAVLKEV